MVGSDGDIRVGGDTFGDGSDGDISAVGDTFGDGNGGREAEGINGGLVLGFFRGLDKFLIREFSSLMATAVTFVFLWESPRVLFMDFIMIKINTIRWL